MMKTINGISKANLAELEQIIAAASTALNKLDGQVNIISQQYEQISEDSQGKKDIIDNDVQIIADDKSRLAAMGVDAPETNFSGLVTQNQEAVTAMGGVFSDVVAKGIGTMISNLTSGQSVGAGMLSNIVMGFGSGVVGLTGTSADPKKQQSSNNKKAPGKPQNQGQDVQPRTGKDQQRAKAKQQNQPAQAVNEAEVARLTAEINEKSAEIQNLTPQVSQAAAKIQSGQQQLENITAQNTELNQTVTQTSAQIDTQVEKQKAENEQLRKQESSTQQASTRGVVKSGQNTARSGKMIVVGGQKIAVGTAAETNFVSAAKGAELIADGTQDVAQGGASVPQTVVTTAGQTANAATATGNISLTEFSSEQLSNYGGRIKMSADNCLTMSGEISSNSSNLISLGSELLPSLTLDFSSIEGQGSANRKPRRAAA